MAQWSFIYFSVVILHTLAFNVGLAVLELSMIDEQAWFVGKPNKHIRDENSTMEIWIRSRNWPEGITDGPIVTP